MIIVSINESINAEIDTDHLHQKGFVRYRTRRGSGGAVHAFKALVGTGKANGLYLSSVNTEFISPADLFTVCKAIGLEPTILSRNIRPYTFPPRTTP